MIHIAVVDADATYGAHVAAENNTFNNTSHRNQYAKNKNNMLIVDKSELRVRKPTFS